MHERVRAARVAIDSKTDTIYVVDTYNNRLSAWDFSVFLRAPMVVAFTRMAARDGVPPDDRLLTRYRDGQKLYLTECGPEHRAAVVVDHTDITAPWIVGEGPDGDA